MIDSPYETDTPMPWLEPDAPTALCAEVDGDLWFPDGGKTRTTETAFARQLCRLCPLQLPCATWAAQERPEGIWGGLGPTERRRMRAA